MARKKNLERAIVLGLILSTSIYGSAWAAEVTTGDFENAANGHIEGISVDGKNYTISKDTTINGNTTGSALNWSWLGNKVITVENNANLTFNGIQLNNSTIKGNGNVTVENDNGGLAVFVGGDIQANSLTLNTSTSDGIYLYEHDLTIDVEHLTINSKDNGIIQETSEKNEDGSFRPLTRPTNITINNTQSININSSGSWAVHNNSQAGVLNNIYMRSDKAGSVINLMGLNGVSHTSSGETILKADNVNIGSSQYYGVFAGSSGLLDITAVNDVVIKDREIEKGNYARDIARAQNGTLVITAQNGNTNLIGESGVHTVGTGTATITAAQLNRILAADNTLHATGGDILITGQNNTIGADADVLSSNFDFVYGDGKAISPENTSVTTVIATGENGYNDVRGAVVVEKGASTVNITGANNYVSSEYKQVTAADEDERNIVSAVYTKGEGALVTIDSTGDGINVIQSTAKDTDSEHTIWAQQGGNIEINGRTIVNAHNAGVNTDGVADAGNAYGVAVAAGTGDISDYTTYDGLPELTGDRSTVNLNYSGESQITGDIVSGYGGLVNIGTNSGLTRSNSNGNLVLQGNALAGNGGILNLNLGDGGVWYGRADDYGDAGSENSDGSHQSFYNPAFSNEILEGGSVNLTMGDGAKWYVQGQSWITSINTTGNALIDLTNVGDGYENYDSHALTVYNLNGGADIKMSLDGDRQFSDMLYIGNGTGTYNIELDKIVTVEDMYAEFGEGNKFSGLRFATVGKGSDVNFNVTASDKGFNNVIYTVGKDVYDSDVSSDENSSYNGDKMTLEKPGNSGVKDFLDGVESDSAAANKVLLLADENATGDELDNKNNHLNYKLIDMHTEYSDTGKAIIATSRANYSNAIYMDRLNKRLGEARYINSEEDEGMWVRIRHDRIGKDDAYRSQNTMYELGYDQKQECDNGERRVGMAIDYMHGDTGYNDIAGKGEIDRYGLWLYDTWMGDKGHYADYVAKWGHLSSEFDVYAPTSGEKISGDYCNNVLSISAEYGRKKDIGSDWYFEPQIQAQLARVTGADYTTSQGTKVNVDGINSLIGRAGFRLGKDFGEEKQSTVYIKADVLHEFLGEQDIRAFDTSTNGWQRISYENEGTWYDVGFGFATQMSKSSYAFMDFEKSFGNDNDETYQINVGMQWSF